MKVINLIENIKGKQGYFAEHGLSFYIEMERHKILVDTGTTNAFLVNARKLDVKIEEIDTVILSHGHYDHAGGILGFVKENSKAQIWMQRTALEEYYHKNDEIEKYIGIDPKIKNLSQIKLLDGDAQLDEGIFLFTGVCGRRLWPSGNRELMVKREGDFFQDDFSHEQYLVLEERGKSVLISGCAHNGILNILDRYQELFGKDPEVVISGFHMRKTEYAKQDLDVIKEIALELKKRNTIYFTGHCTGERPYQMMKEHLGEQLNYVYSGDEISLF